MNARAQKGRQDVRVDSSAALSADLALVRKFIEDNGYEVITVSDGNRSAVPMDTVQVLAALDRLAEAGFHGAGRVVEIRNREPMVIEDDSDA